MIDFNFLALLKLHNKRYWAFILNWESILQFLQRIYLQTEIVWSTPRIV